MNCRSCSRPIEPFMSFGRMPIANGFLLPEEFSQEYFFDLMPSFCTHCGMFQIIEQPDPGMMFHGHYAFFSQTSTGMCLHFQSLAESVIADCLTINDPFVVEIGSNDGILLRHFAKSGFRHLGVEPSANVAQVATSNGVNTISCFFNTATAEKIRNENGEADVILAANVMCHIPTIHDVISGIRLLLKPEGRFLFEDPYLGNMIEKTAYDQIYDEHVFIFSVGAVVNLFQQYDLEVIDVLPQPTHGGSMRYTIARRGFHRTTDRVEKQLQKERAIGLHKPETFLRFKENCEQSKKELMKTLQHLLSEKQTVAGYGATSKSTTIINYCGITPDHLVYISDTTPTKQGKYSPGAHIPILPYTRFSEKHPHVALLFAWNHAEEIMAKENRFRQSGGRWLLYVPEVTILS